jgi:hypothetical protein
MVKEGRQQIFKGEKEGMQDVEGRKTERNEGRQERRKAGKKERKEAGKKDTEVPKLAYFSPQSMHILLATALVAEEEDVFEEGVCEEAAALAFTTVLWGPRWPSTFPLSGMQSGHSINGEEEDVCEEVAVLAFATCLWDPGWPIAFPLPKMQIGHSIKGEEEDVCEEAAALAFTTVLWDPGWPRNFPLPGMQSGHCIFRVRTGPGGCEKKIRLLQEAWNGRKQWKARERQGEREGTEAQEDGMGWEWTGGWNGGMTTRRKEGCYAMIKRTGRRGWKDVKDERKDEQRRTDEH